MNTNQINAKKEFFIRAIRVIVAFLLKIKNIFLKTIRNNRSRGGANDDVYP